MVGITEAVEDNFLRVVFFLKCPSETFGKIFRRTKILVRQNIHHF